MSSTIIVKGSEGFVVSTDSIVFKYATDNDGKVVGKIKGLARKMFQLSNDVVVAAVGNWNTYFPILNEAAKLSSLPTGQLVQELLTRCINATDSRVYVLYRLGGNIHMDIVENGQVTHDAAGAVMYPDPLLNQLFLTMYESPAAMQIRVSGMLGMAALVHAFNAFAVALCNDISAPFDTILFLNDGLFVFSGGVSPLPVGNFI